MEPMTSLSFCGRRPRRALHAGLFLVAAALLEPSSPARAQPASVTAKALFLGPLAVQPNNRRYFWPPNSDACTALYLAGTQHRANVQDVGATYPPPAFDFAATYPPADAPRANFIRGWHHEHSRWDRNTGPDDWVLPLPFARTGSANAADGKPRFDLTRYDGSYVSRLQSRATTAGSELMYLSLMLFNGFSVENRSTGEFTYPNHPFRGEASLPRNNVNGIDGDWTTAYPDGVELHSLVAGKPAAVTSAQDNYVRHLVQSLNGYRNILWEVSNESHAASLPWQNYIAGVIRNQEATLPNRHLVWFTHPRGASNVAVYNSTADVVSPSANELAVTATGGTVAGTAYRTDPPVTSGAKIVILETDHLRPACDWCSGAWVWKAFTRGYHVSLLDDITDATYAANRQQVRDAIDDTVAYAQKVRLVEMAPQSENVSIATVCSTRYCLYTSNDPDPQPFAPAVPNGNEYLVFKPGTTAEVTIHNLPATSYGGEWLNVATSQVSLVPQFTHSGGGRLLTSPYGTAEAVLWLKRSGITYPCSK
jgi:hypothetical protein